MMFHLLSKINYNQSWEGIKHDLGYDLGDYHFIGRDSREIILRLARQMHIELENVFNADGSPYYLSEHTMELIKEGSFVDTRTR